MKLIFTLFLCLHAFAVTAFAVAEPNIVLFLVDDMGWMDTAAYGSRYYQTPNMQRLARQSMRFTDAYAVPLCSPTRATILSGQHSARHGVTSATGHRPARPAGVSRYPDRAASGKRFIYAEGKNYLDPGLTTIAEVLRGAGYRTGHFGKWHLGVSPEHWPDKHGFETTWHCTPDPGPPSYFSPYGVHPDGRPAGRHKVGNITDGPDGEYITDRLTDEALKFIDAHRDEPFYLNLCQYAVHGPWGHKEAYTRVFANRKDPRGEQRNPIMASMLQSVDESLGRVLDKLDDLGLAENTLLIFYSDNGGNVHSNVPGSAKTEKAEKAGSAALKDWRRWAGPEPPTNNAPLREGKARIYEGGQRVPLMVRWPGRVKPGSTSDAVVGAIDLYPTILDALRIPKPDGHIIDGESFLPALKQTGTLSREAYFTWFPHIIPAVSVRSGDYKLIRRWEPHPEYPEVRELYNLRDDLGETSNLAAKMPGKLAKLDALIDRFIEDTGALAPKPNPAYRPHPPTAGGTSVKDPAAGLVPKMCKATIVEGALRVEAEGRTPFLGTAQVKLDGPVTLTLRARGKGGVGRVRWKTAAQDNFPAEGQVVSYTLADREDWQEISVDLPVRGRIGIVRVYLPVDEGAIEIRSIRFAGKGGTERGWDFARVKP